MTRAYDRSNREAQADALSARILDSVLELVEGMDIADVSLELASRTAGVSVPTVVRKFGSKDGLYAAAFARARQYYRPNRRRGAPDTDLPAFIVRAQLTIYERWGRALLYLRTREALWPVVHEELERGRRERRRWLGELLAEPLSRVDEPEALLDQVFALSDVHLWAVLRLDLGCSKRRTQQRMENLLRAHLVQSGLSLRSGLPHEGHAAEDSP